MLGLWEQEVKLAVTRMSIELFVFIYCDAAAPHHAGFIDWIYYAKAIDLYWFF